MDDKLIPLHLLTPADREEWAGIPYLLGQVEPLRALGLLGDEASRTILAEYQGRRESIRRRATFADAMGRARALAPDRPRESLGWAEKARSIDPRAPEAWLACVTLLRRLHRFTESEALSAEATAIFPDLAPRLQPPPDEPKAQTPAVRFEGLPGLATPPGPALSWSTVAGEFVQEHWQKLILGLAVLLIVVSSTVGAHLVLGPRLWSPIGKGVLALAFTALCGGFGVGLVRWGADRAGRMMLATTLAVIPINLMLDGELRLLVDPSTTRVALAAADAALLFLLTRGVAGALGIASGGWFALAYFAMAAFNAGSSPGMAFEAGFPVFLAPAAIYLGAVAWLNRKGKAGSPDVAYLELGLLTFAFLAGTIRTGALVLHLGPALYAVPAMLAAIAAVTTARAVGPIEKDGRRVLLLHQGGLVLSALAFALAMARPPGASALYSGNTLATAILGLSLYAGSLRETRRPPYLYAAFASLFIAYFGAFYFASDLIHAVEEVARQALGYDRKLPQPFKAINGLVFNLGLAWLSRFFIRRWDDARLARHCHYIGLPLSVAACVFSGFEPKAAAICCGGYALLYAAGVRFFVEPRLIYLACAAAAGSAYFGSTLGAGMTHGARSALASALGLAFWAIRWLPGFGRLGEAYRSPLARSALAMAVVAVVGSTFAAPAEGATSPWPILAFAVAAALATLDGFDRPRVATFLFAIAASLGAWLVGFEASRFGGSPMAYAMAVSAFAPVVLLLAEWAGPRAERSGPARAYLGAVAPAVLAIVAASGVLIALRPENGGPVAGSALVWGLSLIGLTRVRREAILVYAGIGAMAASAASACGLATAGREPGFFLVWLAATYAGLGLIAWGVGERGRRRAWDELYVTPCLDSAGWMALAVGPLAVLGRLESVASYPIGVGALVVGSAVFALLATSRRRPIAVALGIAWLVGASDLILLSQVPPRPEMAWVLGLVAAVEAVACWGVGRLTRRWAGGRGSPLARPLEVASVLLALASVPMAYRSPVSMVVAASAFLLLVESIPSVGWLYGTFGAVGLAAYFGGIERLSGGWKVASAVAGGYLACGLGLLLQRSGARWRERLGLADLPYADPPFRSAIGLGMLAAIVRAEAVVGGGSPWWGEPWLPWALAGLCLLMLRYESHRGWVDSALGLSGVGAAMAAAPLMVGRAWWWPVGMGLACLWAMTGRVLGRFEGTSRERSGLAMAAEVVSAWGMAAFGVVGAGAVGVVCASVLPWADPVSPWVGWWELSASLALAGLYLGIDRRRFGQDGLVIGAELVMVLALWWVAAKGSPAVERLGLDRSAYLPLVSAAMAVGVVAVGLVGWRRGRDWLDRFTRWGGFGLALVSVGLLASAGPRVATVTLGGATLAFGLLAMARGRRESAYAGGVAWFFWALVAAGEAVRSFGWDRPPWSDAVPAIAFASALFGLRWARRWARADGEAPIGVARAFDRVAVGAAACAALASIGIDEAGVAGGLLIALAVYFGLMATDGGRKGAWPVYPAQALLLMAYFRLRPIDGPSGFVDAVILSSLAYLDLGLAELMGRLGRPRLARPTVHCALALPLVPILKAAWDGIEGGPDLFVLLACAAFYATAAADLRTRKPAYAAAVLFDAFLWAAWSQLGWRMADSPQFYLVPVGLTVILMAEANRRELGREGLNVARNLGLVVIYASLAAPIWQSSSFGAWLGLLVLSLAGVFAGIGLRVQSFLWMGLAGFVADVVYQLGRIGLEHATARWAVMLGLGVLLVLFVALNEKKQIVATVRVYYDRAREWD